MEKVRHKLRDLSIPSTFVLIAVVFLPLYSVYRWLALSLYMISHKFTLSL